MQKESERLNKVTAGIGKNFSIIHINFTHTHKLNERKNERVSERKEEESKRERNYVAWKKRKEEYQYACSVSRGEEAVEEGVKSIMKSCSASDWHVLRSQIS